jgi:mediator of RNA polymerase II transcription subunit 14
LTDYGRLGERKGLLYIQLKRFPDNYLVLVVKAKGFSYVLMTTRGVPEDPLAPMAIDDIAFLNFERLKASRNSSETSSASNPQPLGAFNDLRSDVGVSAG